MDFRAVLQSVTDALRTEGIDCALIGGMALAALGVPRATMDIDLLVPSERANDVAQMMRQLGYEELHRSEDAANYVRRQPPGRVDFLFARRAPTHAMLARARRHRVLSAVELNVVEAEDVIGLKVQASSNDPQRRPLDVADIERLLAAHPSLDLGRVREYFRLFDREEELDALLARRRQP